MPYRIAGMDVHKKRLAVVVSDVGGDGEYEFERRLFGSRPEELRSPSAWLLEQEVEEAVMESTAQYWKPVWGAQERFWKPMSQKREGAGLMSGAHASGRGSIKPRTSGTQEELPRCRKVSEAAGGTRADFEFCARCRAASVADGDAPKVSTNAKPASPAVSTG